MTVVGRVTPPRREFVGDQGSLLVLIILRRWPGGGGSGPARGQHADEVAVPHRAFGQFLVLTPSWAEQVAQDHGFQFGPELMRGPGRRIHASLQSGLD
jgi:hypothetical protein